MAYTITSATLASDGVTLTLNTSGASGALTTGANSKSEIECSHLSAVVSLSSITTTGSGASAQIIATLSLPLPSTGVSIIFRPQASGGTLDAGSAAGTLNAGVSLTNSSTQAAASLLTLPNNQVVFSALFSDSGTVRSLGNAGWQLDLVLNATDAWITGAAGNNADAWEVSVDGGAFTVLNNDYRSTGQTSVSPLFNVLSGANHTLSVRGANSQIASFRQASFIRYKGGTGPSGYPSGMGPNYQVATTAGAVTTPFRAIGGLASTNTGTTGSNSWYSGTNSAITIFPDSELRFVITGGSANHTCRLWSLLAGQYFGTVMINSAGTLKVYGNMASGKEIVTVGGTDQTLAANQNGSAFGWATIATGLDGNDLVQSTPAAPANLIGFLGDSITYGLLLADNSVGWVHRLAILLGDAYGIANRGIPSTTCKDFTGVSGASQAASFTTQSGQANYSRATGCSPNILVNFLGTNDELGAIGVTVTPTDLDTAYTAMLSSELTALPSVSKVLCLGLLPNSTNSQSTVDTWSGDSGSVGVKGAVVANGSSKLVYRSLRGMNLGSSTYTAGGAFSLSPNYGDGIHPNGTGDAIFANLVVADLAAAGYTVSLSASSGAAGSPITITYTRAVGSTWNTGETVATSDASSGTFGAFTFTPGQPTATRTYTPASAGTKTLTHTSGQSWTDPATSSFTATSATTLTINSPSSLTQAVAGQSMSVTLTGATSSSASDWALAIGGTSGSVTALSSPGASPTLTVTAPNATGTATLTHTPSGATATISVVAGPSVAASASPNPATGTTTTLTATPSGFGSGLTYAWIVASQPSGANATFSNSAVANPVVTLNKAGAYTFTCTCTDASSNNASGTTSTVTVNQTATTLSGLPATVSSSQQLAPSALDQFGTALSSQPTWTYTGSGGTSSVNGTGAVTVSALSIAVTGGGLSKTISESFGGGGSTAGSQGVFISTGTQSLSNGVFQ